MKAVFHALMLAGAITMFSSAAHAQGGPGGKARQACALDAKTFCSDVQPGGGRVMDCLQDHYKEISDACYSVMEKMAARGGHQGGGHDGPPPPDGKDAGPPDSDSSN